MYQLLGDIIVDTDELIADLKSKGIIVAEDITAATKRDDAIGFRVLAPISELGIKKNKGFTENEMEVIMQKAESLYESKFENALADSLRFRIYAYRYDEVNNAILLNVAIMDWEIGRRKLDDVIKRLFDV